MINNVIKIGGSIFSNALAFENFYNNISQINSKTIIVISAFGKSTQALRKIAFKSIESFNVSLKLIENYHSFYFELAELLNDDFKLDLMNKLEFHKLRLIDLAKGINLTKNLTLSTLDLILSFGEIYSYEFIQLFCKFNDIKAEFLDARELIKTDSNFGNAKPLYIETQNLLKAKINSSELNILFIQGFIASTLDGKTSTMGFESSNLTATILAKTFEIKHIDIITDVDGIRNADPKIVNNTRLIESIDYNFAYLLAENGLNLLFNEMIVIAENNNIKIKISSYKSKLSTSIYKDIKSKEKIMILDSNSFFGKIEYKSLNGRINILNDLHILNLKTIILDDSIYFCYKKNLDFKKIKFDFKKENSFYKINLFNVEDKSFEKIFNKSFIFEVHKTFEFISLIIQTNDINKTMNEIYNDVIK